MIHILSIPICIIMSGNPPTKPNSSFHTLSNNKHTGKETNTRLDYATLRHGLVLSQGLFRFCGDGVPGMRYIGLSVTRVILLPLAHPSRLPVIRLYARRGLTAPASRDGSGINEAVTINTRTYVPNMVLC